MNYKYTQRHELLFLIPNNYTKVLEIGCGSGEFFKNLKEECEIWGIEPSKEAASKCLKIYRIFNGSYDQVINNLPKNYFDLVICNDVIEHMVDHDLFFHSIKKVMSNNCIMIGSIPNVRYYTNFFHYVLLKDWKYVNEGILDRTHQRFFTEKSLKNTLKNHHYDIIQFKKINKKNAVGGLKDFFHYILLKAIVFFTLGYYQDLQYLHMAFEVRYNENDKE